MDLYLIGNMNKNVIDILNEYHLWKEFNWILRNNKSNNLPYHGLRHTLYVMESCYKIFNEIYQGSEAIKDNPKLILECNTLLTAALFHDFDHSGGKLNDAGNIELALEGYYRYLEETNTTHLYQDDVLNLISSTEFPYKTKGKLFNSIIRDADLSQSASEDFIYFVLGLKEESNSEIEFENFIQNTIKFNSDNHFKLAESKVLFNEQRSHNLILLNNLLK